MKKRYWLICRISISELAARNITISDSLCKLFKSIGFDFVTRILQGTTNNDNQVEDNNNNENEEILLTLNEYINDQTINIHQTSLG